MERITKRVDEDHACFAICEKECPDGIYEDNPACTCTASKMAMKRLLEYEDTGLTPDQIVELKERDTAKAPEVFDGHWYKCPTCGMYAGGIKGDFCHRCGQRLKWEE